MNKANEKELAPWLALFHLNGVGPKRFSRLLEWFGSAEAAVNGDRKLLRSAGLSEQALRELDDYCLGADSVIRRQVDDSLAWHALPTHHILTLDDIRYPALLKHIHDPSPVLFVAGNAQTLSEPSLAMVGSRQPSIDGKDNAYRFARALACTQISVTSGLAIGVDGVAHSGALDGSGKTTAVIGTGIDQIYPAQHRSLAQRIIAEEGAIVSEFPLGTSPRASNFPRRNRTISGLSLGVLVVEANIKSGSLITAQFAVDQGREVYAIPGSIHNPMSRGCHALIKQGAKLVEVVDDITEEISQLLAYHQLLRQTDNEIQTDSTDSVTMQASLFLNNEPPKKKISNSLSASMENCTPEEADMLKHMGYDVASMDMLVERSGQPVEIISPLLMMMEINGIIHSVPGGYQRL